MTDDPVFAGFAAVVILILAASRAIAGVGLMCERADRRRSSKTRTRASSGQLANQRAMRYLRTP